VFVTVTLANTVDPGMVPGLPEYVTGIGEETPKGSMRVETLVYAPPGYAPVRQSTDTALTRDERYQDGDFSVGTLRLVLAPGETRTLTYEYVADAKKDAVIEVDTTPVVTKTALTQQAVACQ
jgi:hypothetical protein